MAIIPSLKTACNSIFVLLCFFIAVQMKAQAISGQQLLQKAIQYHDPNNQWETFKGTLSIEMKMPNGSNRLSEVSIDLPHQYFKLTAIKNDTKVEHIVANDQSSFSLNGKTTFTDEEIKTFGLNDARAKFMKNYYTFLYGLPMKLKDSGTIINPIVTTKTFMNKEYLVLQVKYEEGVGKDAWYFYFDPKTYAMEIYQFYHDEAKNDGEYILLAGEDVFKGMKFPKDRSWYLNKDKSFLATDYLTKVTPL